MKSVVCNKNVVNKLKNLWDKYELLIILFLEDASYEQEAVNAYLDFSTVFNNEMYALGVKNATLSFTTGVALGDETNEVYSADNFYNKRIFYETCIKKMPLNRFDEMFQYCFDRMTENIVLSDNK